MVSPAALDSPAIGIQEAAVVTTSYNSGLSLGVSNSATGVAYAVNSGSDSLYSTATSVDSLATYGEASTAGPSTLVASASSHLVASSSPSPSPSPASSTSRAAASTSTLLASSSLQTAASSISTDATASSGPGGIHLTTPMLVAIGVGAAVLIVAVGLLVSLCVCCRRKQRARRAAKKTRGARRMDSEGEWKEASTAQTVSPSQSQAQRPVRGQTNNLPTSYSGYDLDLTRDEAADVLHLPRPQPTFARHSQFHPSSLSHNHGHARLETGLGGGRESVWTDDSEMDMFAADGSTIARTLSTISRPNSEYDIERDAGTWTGGNGTGTGTYQTEMGGMVNAFGGFRPSTATSSSPWGTSHTGPSALSFSPISTAPTYHSNSSAGPSSSRARATPPRLMVDTKIPSGELVSSAPSSSSWPSASASGTWTQPQPTRPIPSGSSLYPYPNTPQYPPTLVRGPSSGSRFQAQPMSARSDPFRSPDSAGPTPTSSEAAYDSYLVAQHQTLSRSQSQRTGAPGAAGSSISVVVPSGNGTAPPALRRGPTIIRHADAGRVEQGRGGEDDEDEDDIHLPPAYGDIYGSPERP